MAWILVAASATHHWIAWRSESGTPKVTRCGAYSTIMSSARCAMPTDQAAIWMRRVPSRSCIGAKPLPSVPSSFQPSTRQSSSAIS